MCSVTIFPNGITFRIINQQNLSSFYKCLTATLKKQTHIFTKNEIYFTSSNDNFITLLHESIFNENYVKNK